MRCTWGWWRRREARPRRRCGAPAKTGGCTAAELLRAHRERRGLSREQAVLCMPPSVRMSARWLRAVEEGAREWVRDLDRSVLPASRRQRAALDDLLRIYGVTSDDLLAAIARTRLERTRPAPRSRVRGSVREPSGPAWRRHLALAGRSGVAGAVVLAGGALTADGRVGDGVRASAVQTTTAPSLGALPPRPAALPGRTEAPPPAPVAAPAVAAAGSRPPARPASVPGVAPPRRPVAAAGLETPPAPFPARGPVAALSTTLVDFGTVPVGSSVSRAVSITNAGQSTLHVDRLLRFWADEVAIGDDSCTARGLLPGERCSFVLTYTPTRTGMLAPSPHVEVIDDAPGGGQEIELRGATT
jgi:hypothetical protein